MIDAGKSRQFTQGHVRRVIVSPGGVRRTPMQNKVEPTITRIVMATTAAVLLSCGSAFA
jgi:hypothetical protein